MTDAINAAATPAIVLTRAEKVQARIDLLTKRIAADTAALEAIRLEVETAAKLAGVVAGTAIVAKLGRAETTREVNARVTGVKEDENGSVKYKIVFGEGFDADVQIINASQIVRVIDETPAAE